MALGAPVLYLNHQGPKGGIQPYDATKGTGTGFAVEPGSLDALTDGLRQAIAWAAKPAKEREQLQRVVMEQAKTFDIRRMADNHAALLREAVTQPANPQ